MPLYSDFQESKISLAPAGRASTADERTLQSLGIVMPLKLVAEASIAIDGIAGEPGLMNWAHTSSSHRIIRRITDAFSRVR